MSVDRDSDTSHEATGKELDILLFFSLSSPFFSEPTRVDDLRRMYPDFDNIYRRQIDKAKFDVVKSTEFRTLKERLTFVLHHLNERPQLAPKKRTELIQALLSVDDLRDAQHVLRESDKTKESAKSSWFSMAMGLLTWSKVTNEESLRKEARKITKNITDSEFLRELKDIQDKDLVAAIHEAMALAHSYLSSSIDVTVNKMTHAVLQMQEEECKRRVRREIETEERNALDDIRVKFIRDVNQNFAGRGTS